MKVSPAPAPPGFALVVVMIAVFVLSALAGAFAYSMKVETKLAMNAQGEADDLWAGRSGVELAKAKLLGLNCPYCSLNQQWAGGAGDDCDTNSLSSDLPLDNFQVGDRFISVKIVNLESKFNINMADPDVLQQALSLVGVDGGAIPAISSAIIDWIDRDDRTSPNGAESDYYQSLQPPYYAKNAPIDDLSELLLVRGVDSDMYWGPASTNHSIASFQQLGRYGRPIDAPNYTVGLVDLFTPLSSGRINVNTASAQVLQLIPGIDENVAVDIVRQRDMAPYRSLNEVPVPPQVRPQLMRFGDVQCRTFEVQVTVKGSHRKYFAIIGRTGARDMQTLSFYWKDL